MALDRDIPATRIWALAESYDPFTNYTSWSYAAADADGSLILDNISYGGNRTLNMQHQRKISFSYTSRQDIETEFVGGSPVSLTKRLASISASFNKAMLYTYTFDYDYAPVTGFSRLQTVTLSDASNAPVSPLRFEWSDSASSVFNEVVALKPLQYDISTVQVFPADADGSGRTGLILASRQLFDSKYVFALDVYLADGEGGISTEPASSGSTGLQYPDYLIALDVNGDGKIDLVCDAVQMTHF